MEEVLIKGEDECVGLGVKDRRGEMTDNRIDGFVKRAPGVLSVKEAVREIIWTSVDYLGTRYDSPTPPRIQHIQSSTFSQVSSFFTRSLPNPLALSPSYLSALVQFSAN
jgi:hypothetical protein